MKFDERKRVLSNQECIALIHKPLEDITDEEKEFLKEEFTGFGSVFGKALGLAQFYTPDAISRFIAKYINHVLPNGGKGLEPACGSGSLIRNLDTRYDITAIEVDENTI